MALGCCVSEKCWVNTEPTSIWLICHPLQELFQHLPQEVLLSPELLEQARGADRRLLRLPLSEAPISRGEFSVSLRCRCIVLEHGIFFKSRTQNTPRISLACHSRWLVGIWFYWQVPPRLKGLYFSNSNNSCSLWEIGHTTVKKKVKSSWIPPPSVHAINI